MEDRAMYAGLRETIWQQAERVAAEAHKERKAAASPGVTESFDPFDDLAPKETDPNGLAPHEPGAKLDAGKVQAGLLLDFGRALTEVAHVATYGAKKYSKRGWTRVPDGVERYTDALMRHLLLEDTGDGCDPESELLHASHAAWNALARLELMLREYEE